MTIEHILLVLIAIALIAGLTAFLIWLIPSMPPILKKVLIAAAVVFSVLVFLYGIGVLPKLLGLRIGG